jgi:hypothetical protein
MPSVIMHRWLAEQRAFAVETFFKNNGSAKVGLEPIRRFKFSAMPTFL